MQVCGFQTDILFKK